jgi:hypothetical protein
MQTLGVVAAAVLVAKLIPIGEGSSRYTFSGLVVTAVLSLVLFFTSVDRGVRLMREERQTLGASAQPFCNGAPCRPFLKLTAAQATNQVGARLGVNAPFIQWVKNHMRSSDSYYLVMTADPQAAAFPLWITYRLLPNLATGIEGQLGNGTIRQGSPTAANSADWIVFYGVDARKRAIGGKLLPRRDVETFSPTFSLARRKG